MLFFILNREDFSFVIHLDRQPRTSRRREAQTGSRARSGSRSERTLDAVEHSRTLMEWWPFLIFHRGGLRIKVINNSSLPTRCLSREVAGAILDDALGHWNRSPLNTHSSTNYNRSGRTETSTCPSNPEPSSAHTSSSPLSAPGVWAKSTKADGSPWEGHCVSPGAPPEQCRVPFHPDASRIFEEIDRLGVGGGGRNNLLGSKAAFDFYRPAPSEGYRKGLRAKERTDIGDGDIPENAGGGTSSPIRLTTKLPRCRPWRA